MTPYRRHVAPATKNSLFDRPWVTTVWTWLITAAAIAFSWLGTAGRELLSDVGWWGVLLAPFILLAPMFVFGFTLMTATEDGLVAPVASLGSVMCFLAAFGVGLFDLGDYRLIHLYITLAAIGLATREFRGKRFELLFWVMATIAVVHFPFLRWGIERHVWERINVLTGIVFGVVGVRALQGKFG